MNENIFKVISWTLIHSLWEGLILSVAAGAVILFTRKKSSLLRYNLLCIFFLLFLVSSGLTLKYEISRSVSIEGRAIAGQEGEDWDLTGKGQVSYLTGNAAAELSGMRKLVDFLNNNAFLIVFLWFIVFTIKSFSILKDLGNIYRIRNYRTQSPPEHWTNRLAELRQLLGIAKYVKLLESGLVSVPGVTGFIKPVILVPVGMLSHMSGDQVEAVLLHELAHIRRRDYIVNFVQCFAEIIFFFNPGILWVSTLLREERENCCDDVAISVLKNKSRFVSALVSFQEYNLSVNQLSMGFGHQKTPLLNRAKRILYSNNKSLNKLEKALLSICLLASGLFMFAFSAGTQDQIQSLISNKKGFTTSVSADTSGSFYERKLQPAQVGEGTFLRSSGQGEASYIFKHKNVLYQVQGDFRRLKVNGKPVAPEEMNAYLPVVKQLMNAVKEQDGDSASSLTLNGTKEKDVPGKAVHPDHGILLNGKSTHYFSDGMAIEVRDQKVVRFSLNGKEVPETETGKYLSKISEAMTNLHEEVKNNEAEKLAKSDEDLKRLDNMKAMEADRLNSLGKLSDIQIKKISAMDAERDSPDHSRYVSETPRYKAAYDENAAKYDAEPTAGNQYKVLGHSYLKDNSAYNAKKTDDFYKKNSEHHGIPATKPGVVTSQKTSATLSRTTITDTKGSITRKTGYAAESIPKDLDVAKLNSDVINELYKEQLIKDVIDLSYKLDANELVVNGKKQDTDLHQKLKDRYIKTPKSAVYYNYTDSAK